MKENKYDDIFFFDRYKQMARSAIGLEAAGEWHEFKKMLPDFKNKRVLDLGCGFGWHCRYAADGGAGSVIGVDISEKMLEEARRKTVSPLIRYIQMPIEDIDFPENSFDAVISSLVFHYVEQFGELLARISRCLVPGGELVFSAEHPVFTAEGSQQWICDEGGKPLYWPVDRYFEEGRREAVFLDTKIVKYHRTLTAYINTLIQSGFEVLKIVEPKPADHMMNEPGMQDELRRPMMLLIAARKRG
jgi:ubiquinone/menaquinone biosynthesis C-methylase UbiE